MFVNMVFFKIQPIYPAQAQLPSRANALTLNRTTRPIYGAKMNIKNTHVCPSPLEFCPTTT
jgi:hypothetical protein